MRQPEASSVCFFLSLPSLSLSLFRSLFLSLFLLCLVFCSFLVWSFASPTFPPLKQPTVFLHLGSEGEAEGTQRDVFLVVTLAKLRVC